MRYIIKFGKFFPRDLLHISPPIASQCLQRGLFSSRGGVSFSFIFKMCFWACFLRISARKVLRAIIWLLIQKHWSWVISEPWQRKVSSAAPSFLSFFFFSSLISIHWLVIWEAASGTHQPKENTSLSGLLESPKKREQGVYGLESPMWLHEKSSDLQQNMVAAL